MQGVPPITPNVYARTPEQTQRSILTTVQFLAYRYKVEVERYLLPIKAGTGSIHTVERRFGPWRSTGIHDAVAILATELSTAGTCQQLETHQHFKDLSVMALRMVGGDKTELRKLADRNWKGAGEAMRTYTVQEVMPLEDTFDDFCGGLVAIQDAI